MRKLALMLMALCVVIMVGGCIKATVEGGPVESAKLQDGVYEGYSSHGPNKARVRVTIADQKISTVELIEHDAWKGHKADEIIPRRIVEKQSTDVDAVSGATNSSNVMMNAVQDAINKASGTADEGDTK